MNMEIGTETSKFLFWEYLFGIFGTVSLQCRINVKVITTANAYRNYTNWTLSVRPRLTIVGFNDPISE